jgi:hypothetical protein
MRAVVVWLSWPRRSLATPRAKPPSRSSVAVPWRMEWMGKLTPICLQAADGEGDVVGTPRLGAVEVVGEQPAAVGIT